MTDLPKPRLRPGLVVQDARRAIDFYQRAFGARQVSCFVDQKLAPGGHVVYAELTFGSVTFSLCDEARDWHNHAPPSLGGTPVIFTIEVDDADAAGARLAEAGAEVVFPVADQFYGERQGRFRDPFGHYWLITQRIKDMSDDDIQRGVDAYPHG